MAATLKYLTTSLADRFAANYIPEPNSGCWLWLGSLRSDGYPCLSIDNKTYRGNRVSLALYKEPVPAGLFACHTCHNIICVNPDHLYAGTPKQNAADMIRAGRKDSSNLKDISDRRRALQHCMRGHPYIAGSRVCLVCRKIANDKLKASRNV